jgi:hypothetical protein
MEGFDGGHFFTLLALLETIHQQNGAAFDTNQPTGKNSLNRLPPTLSEPIQGQGFGVKKIEQAMVTGIRKAHSANQTGDASQVRTDTKGSQHQSHP